MDKAAIYARYRQVKGKTELMLASSAWQLVKHQIANEIALLFCPFKDYSFDFTSHNYFVGGHAVSIQCLPFCQESPLEGVATLKRIDQPRQRKDEYTISRSRAHDPNVAVLDHGEAEMYHDYRLRGFGRADARRLAIENRQAIVNWVDRVSRNQEECDFDVLVSCDVLDFMDCQTCSDAKEAEKFVRSCLKSIADLT